MEAIYDQNRLAQVLGVPKRTLEDWRYRGLGPPYVKVGRQVRYLAADVDAWLREQRVEPGAA